MHPYEKCVEHEGLSAIAANGGMEGLRLAEEYKTSLSLVILDVMMPDLDGFQVLQKSVKSVMFLC